MQFFDQSLKVLSGKFASSQPMASIAECPISTEQSTLAGKRVGLVVLSPYPHDPRPRRAAEVLRQQGMSIDYICVRDGAGQLREEVNGLNIFRVPLSHQRGNRISYVLEYAGFTFAAAAILAVRSFSRRYDLIYINNMPDVLVASALFPKALGAKVILDVHDPMPELMAAIFCKENDSKSIRILKWLERWSMARAHQVITVNAACQRIFASRSCSPEKIHVVMNSPDASIFPFHGVPAETARVVDPTRPFIIMYHGLLVERNGLDLAVDAFSRIKPKIPSARLHVYGKSTPFFQRVMRTARDQGLRNAVVHFGSKPLEEIVKAIETCDLGIIPNQHNQFTAINTPVRIFEYLALGKPVVAPRTRGIQDYFDDGSLFFFEPGNVEDLARQIEFVRTHPDDASRITARGQQVYRANEWSRQSNVLVELVQNLFAA